MFRAMRPAIRATSSALNASPAFHVGGRAFRLNSPRNLHQLATTLRHNISSSGVGSRGNNSTSNAVSSYAWVFKQRLGGVRASSHNATSAATAAAAAWRERSQLWSQTLDRATDGDAAALCDVGWAHHQGMVPDLSQSGKGTLTPTSAASSLEPQPMKLLPVNLPEAQRCYEASAAQGYAPAASLLADLFYYGVGNHSSDSISSTSSNSDNSSSRSNNTGSSNTSTSNSSGASSGGYVIERNVAQAQKWLQKVLDTTSATEADDAYLRVKALQRLGTLASLNHREQGGEAVGSSAEANHGHHHSSAKQYWEEAASLCQDHLGGLWALLLPHDPPGLWGQLQAELELLDDTPKLAQNLNGFVKATNQSNNHILAAVALRAYTRQLRHTEAQESSFTVQLLAESLAEFEKGNSLSTQQQQQQEQQEGVVSSSSSSPSSSVLPSSEAGAWGLTYLSSFFRVFGHPLVQRAFQERVASKENGGDDENGPPKVVVLGSALGNACVWPAAAFGFQAVGYEVLQCCRDTAQSLIDGLQGKARQQVQELVTFKSTNAVEDEEDQLELEKDLKTATLCWANDFSWGPSAQRIVEERAFRCLPSGGILVLYRPPQLPDLGWRTGAQMAVPTSWHPRSPIFVLVK